MLIGYARVSTLDQSTALQVDALTTAGCVKIYTEVVSGAKAERPVLTQVLDLLREGDMLVVWKLDRLGRTVKHLIEVVTGLMDRQVEFKSLNDPIDTTTPHGRLVFHIFAALAEFERELIRERVCAGIAAARARGRNGGRPRGIPKGKILTAAAAETLYLENKLSAQQIARELNISKGTLYSYLRQRGVQIGTTRTQVKVK